jgi:glycosyltransferase involved in cell wall biosynthesis
MNIGIDISPLQGPHRMRGIGYVVLNLVNNLPEEARKNHHFIFYAYPDSDSAHGKVLELLNLEGCSYEVRLLSQRRRFSRNLPGRLRLINSVLNQLIELRDLYLGDSRIHTLRGVDVFLQTDQSQTLPRRGRTKKALILYDIIPYALESDYLWSYRTARKIHGFSRKASFRVSTRRVLYKHKLQVNSRRARVLLAISEQTKSDFVDYFSVSGVKIRVAPLGVSEPDHAATMPQLHQSVKSSWGYMSEPIDLETGSPYLLFVGGADKRRKLQDLVTAFNNLRAQGYDLKLVLAGDSMRGYDTVATEEVQQSLKESSYLEDIIFMGFIDDATRDWLYAHSLAFVFPSRYEGFGLPILEAMTYKSIVITYPNKATREVAGDAPLYVNDSLGIERTVIDLLSADAKSLERRKLDGIKRTQKYSWPDTAKQILGELLR